MDKVWVVYTETDDGSGLSVHETRELAIDSIFAWVSTCWNDYCSCDMPKDKEESIKTYYEESRGMEFYHMEECFIDRGSK